MYMRTQTVVQERMALLGVTQLELAGRLGVSQTYISDVLLGKRNGTRSKNGQLPIRVRIERILAQIAEEKRAEGRVDLPA
jgi:transcriptional regulator with XRE-family HTH domain